MFVRRRGLYLPTGVADARDLRGHLSAERDVVAVNREHQWVSLAQEAQQDIRLADVAEHAKNAKRSRRQRAKDAAEAAKLADLYRAAKSAGARARVRAEMYQSAEMRALRLTKMRKILLAAGLPVLLAFALWSTTGVQAGVARLLNLNEGDPSWWSAWGVEPGLITIVALIIIGRAVLRTSGGDTDKRADIAEWTALTVSLALNIFGGWDGGWAALGGAVAHSLGPLGAAGTAFLIGLFDTYIARADPWAGAKRLADLGFDVELDTHSAESTPALELPPVSQLGYAPSAAQTATVESSVARPRGAEKPRKQPPSKPRAKAATQTSTSGYAPDGDPGAKAAEAVRNGEAESIRKAAQQYGVSEGTVRNRLKSIEADGAQQAPLAAPIPHPLPAVKAGVNGAHFDPAVNQ
ncbi:helix-turn-helix domain-containing protein [Paractinoplanes toevensis]|uniref:HTH psq-type domain-containing protein n=1 Tax=Paractinoplanes toevensis TaxID=571911 RepID=A0A919T465_9ACTN|nr:helix-turn-helix domain-containing protein [Actinoplanes toevensis]GIM88725.1 hypothetical protein Ato02nite_005180 [Actinoplanes toevensis]